MTDKQPTILITDDTKTNREIVRRCLEGQGYLFLEAENGAEALIAIQTQTVDLVILDLMMPVIDGFAVLKELKDDPLHASIPVIINSSLKDERSIQEALTLGGYDYFCKALPRETLEFLLPLKARNAIQSKWLFDEVSQQKRLLEKEIRAAGRYQRFLLPNDVRACGMKIEAVFHPCLDVGGDFFDFVPLRGDKTGIIIADVSGHGVLPAMVTSILKPLFCQYIRNTESPLESLKRLNGDFLTLTDEADFVTAFVAVFDPAKRSLRYANAGHPPPLHLRRATGAINMLGATGIFLGMFDTDEWVVEERDLSVTTGDRMLLVTDGVSETRSDSGAIFGVAGLENVLRDEADSDLENAIGKLWRRLRVHAGSSFADDVTCIAIDFTD